MVGLIKNPIYKRFNKSILNVPVLSCHALSIDIINLINNYLSSKEDLPSGFDSSHQPDY